MQLSYFLLAAGAILLPAVARAQFSFAPGTYQLANGPKGEASLKLALAEGGSPTMMVGVKTAISASFVPPKSRPSPWKATALCG